VNDEDLINPYGASLTRMGDALGLLQGDEEKQFVKDLQDRKIVTLDRVAVRMVPPDGHDRRRWVKC
ncbi:MAG TPA: hypothetical protein VMU80_02565, partial [Bryobacteraceae bacterium]|nr:hypothetical protein [Bryobacteraceae bacterium]